MPIPAATALQPRVMVPAPCSLPQGPPPLPQAASCNPGFHTAVPPALGSLPDCVSAAELFLTTLPSPLLPALSSQTTSLRNSSPAAAPMLLSSRCSVLLYLVCTAVNSTVMLIGTGPSKPGHWLCFTHGETEAQREGRFDPRAEAAG